MRSILFAGLAFAGCAFATPALAQDRISCGIEGTVIPISQTEAITAWHVTQTDGCTINGSRAMVASHYPAHDMAIVRTIRSDFAPAGYSCERLAPGASYSVRGRQVRALGRYASTRDARYSDVRFSHMAQLSGTVPAGASGGPVLNAEGKAVAFVSSATEDRTFVKELADTPLCGAGA